jgi:3-hydroxyisobutyrate dehydrogenase
VITHSAGNSRMFEKRAPRMAAGDHAPHSTVNTFLKDLEIALDTARELQLATPLAATAHTVFARAAQAGHGAHSDTLVARVYEA